MTDERKIFFIKNHKEYTYDEILDKYNETKEDRWLSYAFIKKNNLRVQDICLFMNQPWEKVSLFIFNCQRTLDGLPTANDFKDIERKFFNDKDDFIDDDFNEDEYDF